MRKLCKWKRWIVAGAAAYAVGGCVSSPQLTDFFTTEVARIVSGIVGQLVVIVTNGLTGNLAGS